MKNIISTDKAPAAIGPYSQAIEVNGMVYTSGVIPVIPDTGEIPFSTVNLYARLKGYEQIEIENLQVFADTTTNQNLEMIPLSELPARWDQIAIFDTPPQKL